MNPTPELPAQDDEDRHGVEHADVVDTLFHDSDEGVVTLVMVENRPWEGSDLQLFQLQEKLNAYVSFALDGEMHDDYPAMRGLPVRIRLDCAAEPDDRTLQMLEMVAEQLSFQGIEVAVRVFGTHCTCGEGDCCS